MNLTFKGYANLIVRENIDTAMLQLARSQIEIFEDRSAALFEIELVDFLTATFPIQTTKISHQERLDFVKESIKIAQSFNIFQKETTQYWVSLSLQWGLFFAYDPQYTFTQCDTQSTASEIFRFRQFYRKVQSFVEETYGPDNVHYKAALTKAISLLASDIDTKAQLKSLDSSILLEEVWGQKCAFIGDLAVTDMCNQAQLMADEYQMTSLPAHNLIVLLSLFLGSSFLRDPQYQCLLLNKDKNDNTHNIELLRSNSLDYLRSLHNYV